MVKFYLAFVCVLIKTAWASYAEELLIKRLFTGYNRLVRPVMNESDVINVQFGLALIQIINVDEKNQVLKSNVWEQYVWEDYQLTWNPGDYDGIEIVRVPASKVWTPDIVLFNNADGKYEAGFTCNVVVYFNGTILWVPPAIFQSSCAIDVTYFPFDEQRCEMKFGSWTFNSDKVKLNYYFGVKHIELSDYVKSGTWDITEVPAYLDSEVYGQNAEISPSLLIFWVGLRRKTLFYAVNLVIPCVLLTFLSVLVLYLPVDCGEKMTLAISLLLALVVFLNLVSIILPPSSIVIPLVAKYLLFTFIMNVFTIIVTVVVINWNFRQPTTHKMSKWVRVIFLEFLPKVLCIARPKHEPDPWLSLLENCDHTRINIKVLADAMDVDNDLHHPECQHGQSVDRELPAVAGHSKHDEIVQDCDSGHQEDDDSLHLDGMDAEMTLSAVEFISEHLRMEDTISQIRKDWQYVAMVLDRILLLIFFSVSAIGTGLVVMNPDAKILTTVNQDDIIYKYSTLMNPGLT